jgi:hypothetical protein
MPYNYIEESKVEMKSLNVDEERQSRFSRNNRFVDMFGGRGDRRNLESPERRKRRVMSATFYSETRFRASGHMMPKMVQRRQARYHSYSLERIKAR